MHIREIFEEIDKKNSFKDISNHLYEKSYYDHLDVPYEDNIFSLEYGDSFVTGRIIPIEEGGIIVGVEGKNKNQKIFGDFVYERKGNILNKHLIPIFLDYYVVPCYVMDENRLNQIKEGIFKFIYLDEGDYLNQEAELIEDKAEKLPLEEELSLLELLDFITIGIKDINEENFRNNKKIINFDSPYKRYLKILSNIITRVPYETLPKSLKDRCTSEGLV